MMGQRSKLKYITKMSYGSQKKLTFPRGNKQSWSYATFRRQAKQDKVSSFHMDKNN